MIRFLTLLSLWKIKKKGWIVPLILPGSKLPNERLVVVVCSYQIPSGFLSSGTWRGWSAWLQCCWVSSPHLTACGRWLRRRGAWRCWAGWGWGGSCCGDKAACREPSTLGPRSSRRWSTTARPWPDCPEKPCGWCRRRRSSPEGSPCKSFYIHLYAFHPIT